jgi:hypothetical protein
MLPTTPHRPYIRILQHRPVPSPKRDTPTAPIYFYLKSTPRAALPRTHALSHTPKNNQLTSYPPHRAIAPPNNASHPCPAHGMAEYGKN